ncbi:MAG: IS701 family transposase, partial [Parvularculaceae bacterium]
YEGRSWRGFHHHATLSIAAYGFLISEREMIPPSGTARAKIRKTPHLSGHRRPRGSPDPDRPSRPDLHDKPANAPQRRPRQTPDTMSVLYTDDPQSEQALTFMTQ